MWETKGGGVRGSGGVDVQKGRGLGLPVRLLESCGDGYALLELEPERELGWVDGHGLFMSAGVLPSFPASLGFCCLLLVRACLSPSAVVQAIWPAGGYRWPNRWDHVVLRCHVCCGECV